MEKVYTCIVNGCTNRTDEGTFIRDLCYPCHQMLVSGKITPTKSFLGDMQKQLDSYESKIHNLKKVVKKL